MKNVNWTVVAAAAVLLMYIYLVLSQYWTNRKKERDKRVPEHALASAGGLALTDVYHETCDTIRARDEVSFKLLAFVPLFAASSSGLLAKYAEKLSSPATGLFAVIGMLVTIALYAWERRNIQTCNFFRDRRDDLEERLGLERFGDERQPALFGVSMGKTEAEDLLYAAGLLFWLAPLIKTCS